MPHISVFRMSKVLQYSLESIQSWYCDMTRVYWSIYLDLDSGSESTGAERVSETQLGVLRLRRRGGRGGRTEGGDHCFGFFFLCSVLNSFIHCRLFTVAFCQAFKVSFVTPVCCAQGSPVQEERNGPLPPPKPQEPSSNHTSPVPGELTGVHLQLVCLVSVEFA